MLRPTLHCARAFHLVLERPSSRNGRWHMHLSLCRGYAPMRVDFETSVVYFRFPLYPHLFRPVHVHEGRVFCAVRSYFRSSFVGFKDQDLPSFLAFEVLLACSAASATSLLFELQGVR